MHAYGVTCSRAVTVYLASHGGRSYVNVYFPSQQPHKAGAVLSVTQGDVECREDSQTPT